MTLRLDAVTLRGLDQLSELTERSKASLAARFIDHEKVDVWPRSWVPLNSVTFGCEVGMASVIKR